MRNVSLSWTGCGPARPGSEAERPALQTAICSADLQVRVEADLRACTTSLDLEPFNRLRTEHRLQPGEDDGRRSGDLPRPLRAGSGDDKRAAFEAHRCDPVHRRSDGR